LKTEKASVRMLVAHGRGVLLGRLITERDQETNVTKARRHRRGGRGSLGRERPWREEPYRR
jgi:hypothetical protein